MELIEQAVIKEEVVDQVTISVDDVPVLNCYAALNKNTSLNYVVQTLDYDLYIQAKEECDFKVKEFMDRVLSISNSPSTDIEIENKDEGYSII